MFPEPFTFFVFQCDGIDHPTSAIRERCSVCKNCIFLTVIFRFAFFPDTKWLCLGFFFNHLPSVGATAAVPKSISFSFVHMQIIITQRNEMPKKQIADWALHSKPEKIPGEHSQMCSPVASLTVEKCSGVTQAADRWMGRKNYHWY